MSAPSPLDAKRFFSGTWSGAGELIPRGPARLALRREDVALLGTGEWLSERIVLVCERFEMASGWSFARRMFLEQISPDRMRATADDIPLGATVRLAVDGFAFESFRTWLPYNGLRFCLRCESEARLEAGGALAGRLRLRWLGLPVADLTLRIDRRA